MEYKMLVPQDGEEIDPDDDDMSNMRATLRHFHGDDKLSK
jgi:hypothetical protein